MRVRALEKAPISQVGCNRGLARPLLLARNPAHETAFSLCTTDFTDKRISLSTILTYGHQLYAT